MFYITEFHLSKYVLVTSRKTEKIKINFLTKINKFKILLHLKDQSSEILFRERRILSILMKSTKKTNCEKRIWVDWTV